MKKKIEEELDIDQVYDNYIDLYIHLDKLRWNAIIGVLALFYSVFGVLNQIFHDSKFFLATNGVGCIIMGVIVFQYSKILNKFVAGQDFISMSLSGIEERNEHIFSEAILSPKENGKKFISFFNRRKRSILGHTPKQENIPEKEDISKQRRFRANDIMQMLLSKSVHILFVIGVLAIIINGFYLIFQKEIDNKSLVILQIIHDSLIFVYQVVYQLFYKFILHFIFSLRKI